MKPGAEKAKILIIDDDEDDCYLLMDAISEIDKRIQCTALVDGSDAIDYLKHHLESLPGLIFLGLNMPKLNGKSFLKRILKDSELKNIPITVYSTSRSPLDQEETKILGAFHYIQKPFSFTELKHEVSKVFEMLAPAEA